MSGYHEDIQVILNEEIPQFPRWDVPDAQRARCDKHPAYEADNCPGCGTSAQIPQI